MDKKAIKKFVQEFVKEIDYDIYRGLFVNPEEPEFAKEQIENLVSTVEDFVKKVKKTSNSKVKPLK